MIRARAIRAIALLLASAIVAHGCGKKGDPRAPVRVLPPRLAEFTIDRTGQAVTLRFVVPQPEGEPDAATPPKIDRVDVYAWSRAANLVAPPIVELLTPGHLVTTLRPPAPPAPEPSAASAQPPPGAKTAVQPAWDGTLTFTETLPSQTADSVRYYAVMGLAGRRKGPASSMLRVGTAAALPVPTDVHVDYTETALTLTWTPVSAEQRFFVEETGQAGSGSKRLTPTVLTQPKLEMPVDFGRARCYLVRAVDRQGAVTSIGEATAPVCVTPTDHFAPAPATALGAVPGDGAIELLWNASPSADVAGYVVLRAEGANGTLQPLMTTPVTDTAYRDATARSGVTYDYAVKAVDKAGNTSELSNRQTVTARQRPR